MIEYLLDPICPVCKSVYKNVHVSKKINIKIRGFIILMNLMSFPVLCYIQSIIRKQKFESHRDLFFWKLAKRHCVIWSWSMQCQHILRLLAQIDEILNYFHILNLICMFFVYATSMANYSEYHISEV